MQHPPEKTEFENGLQIGALAGTGGAVCVIVGVKLLALAVAKFGTAILFPAALAVVLLIGAIAIVAGRNNETW